MILDMTREEALCLLIAVTQRAEVLHGDREWGKEAMRYTSLGNKLVASIEAYDIACFQARAKAGA